MAEIHETLLWLGTLEKFDLQWLSNDPIPEVAWGGGGGGLVALGFGVLGV